MTFSELYKQIILMEMPQISLQGKTAMANDRPLKELPQVDVDENIVIIRQAAKGSWVAEGYTLVYFMDSPEAAEMMKTNKMSYLVFPVGTFSSGGSPITDVWKKKFQKLGHEHILGLIQGNSMPDEIFIDMMSVRKKYRRNSINHKMIESLRELFPDAKVVFSSATDDGQKFIKNKYPNAKVE